MFYLKYLAFVLLLASIAMFFFGYLPKTKYKKNMRKDESYFKERTIDKVVLVIIDSLRPDMVYNTKTTWTSVNKNINRSWAYPTIAELQPPSMSLPKIKCMITGAMINFIDIIFNTDAGRISQENLIDMLRKYRNFKINLYGDDTWEKLFPSQFNYSFSISPFFVRDFYEIDKHISENIPHILSDFSSWDFIIMHYLGLDHIGHSFGPYSHHIDKKLSEMDTETGLLLNGIFQRVDSDRTLVILTADHGMSDLGGHGGSSDGELNVPLIFFNKKFQENPEFTIEKVSQNDIAPSLALLLGVPIPADSIGVIPHRLLSLIDGSQNRTRALYTNYFHLTKIVKKLPKSISEIFLNINFSISLLHKSCKNNFSKICLERIQKQHKKLIYIMNDIKEIIKQESINHNFMMIEFAFVLVLLALFICSSCLLIEIGFPITIPGFVFLFSIICLSLSALLLENYNECFFSAFKISLGVMLIILTGHAITGAASSIRIFMELNSEYQNYENILLLTLLLNFLSYGFPSFIKEEHEVWFYLSTSIVGIYLVKEVIQKLLIKHQTIRLKSTYIAAALVLIIDRLLRALNRTGERWSSLPDLGDWLNGSENRPYLITTIIICLTLIGMLLWQNGSFIISIITIALMFLNGIHRLAEINKNRILSDISVWIYYLLIVLQIVSSILSKTFFKKLPNFKISDLIFLISFLICRDQNIVLWTGIIVKRILIHQTWVEEIQYFNIGVQFVIFNILGMTSYFQQGNSNSLTTIDVLPGFVGMPTYIASIVNPLVAIQMYSGNMFWILSWLELLVEKQNLEYNHLMSTSDGGKKKHNLDPENSNSIIDERVIYEPVLKRIPYLFSKIILFLTLISSLFTLFIFFFSLLHKQHINAWSVYAPKLLCHIFQFGLTMILYVFIAKFNIF